MSRMIKDGEMGFLVPIKDPDRLAERLADLVSDSDLRNTMGTSAREAYLGNFTDEIWCSRMEKALRGLGQ